MKLGAISSVFQDRPLAYAAKRMHEMGLECIEIGAGGYFPKSHCDPAALLKSKRALETFTNTLAENKLTLSAFAIHGQPLHPDAKIARAYATDFRNACKLAARIGVDRFTLLAGLPEAGPGDKHPNWILYPFPPENIGRLQWQWDKRLIPYWQKQGKLAADHGVRLCFEMHPADMVWKPENLLRLRDAVGPVVGCNLDPSHLIWQGMSMSTVIRTLGKAIYHTHAKDSRLDPNVVAANGILDAKDWQELETRSWLFRTVGYGNGELFWRDYLSNLRMIGYDDVLSIEHEDPLIDPEEGFERAAQLLQKLMIVKPRTKLWYE